MSDDTTQLPPFVFVPEDDGVAPVAGQLPIWDRSRRTSCPTRSRRRPGPGAGAEGTPWRPRSSWPSACSSRAVRPAAPASDDLTAQRATGQQPVGPGGAQQQPPSAQGQAPGQGQLPGGPGQDPLSSLGQLDVSQLGRLLSQLSTGGSTATSCVRCSPSSGCPTTSTPASCRTC